MPTATQLDELTLRPSVLDRLIDLRPELREEPPTSSSRVLEEVIEAVRRDLQHILNARLAWIDDVLKAHAQVARSIAAFGLPDFTNENLDNPESRERIRRAIEEAILSFEPRLVDVAVVSEPARPHERMLRYRIEAMLRVDPLREPVTFDTVLESTGVAEVRAV